MTAQELAEAAWRALEPDGDTDFARKLGLVGDYRAARVRRWLKGTHEPDYKGTMAMLSAAGLLAPVAEAAWRDGLASEVAQAEQAGAELQVPAQPGRARAERKPKQR